VLSPQLASTGNPPHRCMLEQNSHANVLSGASAGCSLTEMMQPVILC
jgi:hypothetical protein